LVFEYAFLVILGIIDSEPIFHVKTAKSCKRIKKITTIGLTATLFITIFVANFPRSSDPIQCNLNAWRIEYSNSNVTLPLLTNTALELLSIFVLLLFLDFVYW
jgi:hypothetical protein